MKNVIISALFIAIFVLCSSNVKNSTEYKKEFEGTITYNIIAESKNKNITTEKLQSFFGNKMVFYIKNGNYKMTYNGNDVKDIYYINAKNIQFTLRNGIDTLYFSPCDKEKIKLVSFGIQKDTEKILNRECQNIIFDSGETKTSFWFDSNIYINPDNFKEHLFGYINIYYEKAKFPYLKYKYEGENFNLTYIAVEVSEMRLNDSIFLMPNLPKAKLDID